MGEEITNGFVDEFAAVSDNQNCEEITVADEYTKGFGNRIVDDSHTENDVFISEPSRRLREKEEAIDENLHDDDDLSLISRRRGRRRAREAVHEAPGEEISAQTSNNPKHCNSFTEHDNIVVVDSNVKIENDEDLSAESRRRRRTREVVGEAPAEENNAQTASSPEHHNSFTKRNDLVIANSALNVDNDKDDEDLSLRSRRRRRTREVVEENSDREPYTENFEDSEHRNPPSDHDDLKNPDTVHSDKTVADIEDPSSKSSRRGHRRTREFPEGENSAEGVSKPQLLYSRTGSSDSPGFTIADSVKATEDIGGASSKLRRRESRRTREFSEGENSAESVRSPELCDSLATSNDSSGLASADSGKSEEGSGDLSSKLRRRGRRSTQDVTDDEQEKERIAELLNNPEHLDSLTDNNDTTSSKIGEIYPKEEGAGDLSSKSRRRERRRTREVVDELPEKGHCAETADNPDLRFSISDHNDSLNLTITDNVDTDENRSSEELSLQSTRRGHRGTQEVTEKIPGTEHTSGIIDDSEQIGNKKVTEDVSEKDLSSGKLASSTRLDSATNHKTSLKIADTAEMSENVSCAEPQIDHAAPSSVESKTNDCAMPDVTAGAGDRLAQSKSEAGCVLLTEIKEEEGMGDAGPKDVESVSFKMRGT